MNILDLPEDTIRDISSLLGIHDIHNLYITNSVFTSILDHDHFWKNKLAINKYISKYNSYKEIYKRSMCYLIDVNKLNKYIAYDHVNYVITNKYINKNVIKYIYK